MSLPRFMDEAPYQRLSYDDLAMLLHAGQTQSLLVLARILGVRRSDVVANLRSIGVVFARHGVVVALLTLILEFA